MILFLILLVPRFSFGAIPVKEERLVVAVGQSRSIKVAGLRRAAVASGKIAKVRAIPPRTLVITGIRPGRTTVRAWNHEDGESVIHAEVLAPDLFAVTQGGEEPEVIKVAFEFLEMDSALSQSLGIRWPEAFQFSGQAALQGTGATSGLNYSAGMMSARGFLHHLLRQGWAKLLAQPELYVRLGEEAVFHSGGEIPVSTSSEQYGRNQKHVEWKPFGLTVKVRPRSGDRLNISSDINVEISELNRAQAVEGIPGFTRRHVNTKTHSRDGETVILSGLIRHASHVLTEGVPGLSSIPLLGGLFSSKTEGSESSEVLMAVTFSLSTRNDHRRAEGLRDRYDKTIPGESRSPAALPRRHHRHGHLD